MLFISKICRLILILKPEFFPCSLKWDDFLTDQFAGIIVLLGNSSLHKDFAVLLEILLIFLVISRENHDLHGSHQILYGDKCHGLVLFCVFDRFRSDHSSDNLFRTVTHLCHAGLLIQLKILCGSRNIVSPFFFVFLQWMSAQVYAQNFFFKSEKRLLLIFSHIRQSYLEFFLLLFINNIEQ